MPAGLRGRSPARIGVDDPATGAWADDVARLADAAALRDSSLAHLATQVTALAARNLGGGT